MNLQVNKTYLTRAGHLVQIETEAQGEDVSHPFSGIIANGEQVVRFASFTKDGRYSDDNRQTTFDIVNEVKK